MANPGFGARHRGRIEGARRYQTVVMEYAPKADNMARKMEEKAKEIPEEGREPARRSVTAAAKAIPVFTKHGNHSSESRRPTAVCPWNRKYPPKREFWRVFFVQKFPDAAA